MKITNFLLRKKPKKYNSEGYFINFGYPYDLCYKNLDKYKYFIFAGGRTAGKTQAAIRTGLEKMIESGCNVAVLASQFKSRSVISLATDIITQGGNFYTAQSPTDLIFNKSKLKARAYSSDRQDLNDCKLLIIEDAEDLKLSTVESIIKYADERNCKVLFCVSGILNETAIGVKLLDRADALFMYQNFYYNPYCPKAIEKQGMQYSKNLNQDQYEKIWLGKRVKYYPINPGCVMSEARNGLIPALGDLLFANDFMGTRIEVDEKEWTCHDITLAAKYIEEIEDILNSYLGRIRGKLLTDLERLREYENMIAKIYSIVQGFKRMSDYAKKKK